MIVSTIVIFILILGLLIFVHELGHFVMAKRAGMKVEEFGFGFPPRIFGIKKGETTYSVNWIPLGGFVRILGEDPGTPGADDPRSFANGTFWHRLLVLIAGVTMNFVLAWALFFIGFWLVGMPAQLGQTADIGQPREVADQKLAILQVLPDSPASRADFRAGDEIVSIDGQKYTDITEMISYTNQKAGQEVIYTLRRGDTTLEKIVVPREEYPENSGAVGFAPAVVGLAKYGFLDSIGLSFSNLVSRTTAIVAAFGQLFAQLFTQGTLVEGLSGPVGIAVLTRDFARLGLPYLLQFTAILSINLGLINAVPFPALDGGRVLFLIVEKIRGVRSKKWEAYANMLGFVLLILLMVAVTVKDFSRYSEQFKNLFKGLF